MKTSKNEPTLAKMKTKMTTTTDDSDKELADSFDAPTELLNRKFLQSVKYNLEKCPDGDMKPIFLMYQDLCRQIDECDESVLTVLTEEFNFPEIQLPEYEEGVADGRNDFAKMDASRQQLMVDNGEDAEDVQKTEAPLDKAAKFHVGKGAEGNLTTEVGRRKLQSH